jgi:hypothetical protein
MTARAAVAAVLLALAAGARADAPERRVPPPPARLPPPGAERVELHVRFPPWQYTGTFRFEGASGATVDEGVARDQGGFSAGDGVVERVLEGARGTLVLRLSGGAKTPGFPPVFGRWAIVSGTGAYAALAGSGTFTSCGSGHLKASPYEMQTMIGHLARR